MNPVETVAFRSMKREFIQSVEPITLVSSLYRSGYVKKGFYKTVQLFFRQGTSREEVISYLIDSFPFQVGFPPLVMTLDECRYHKLAADLFLKLFELNCDFRVHNSGTENRTKLQSFFRNLKRTVHDAQFKNPKKALRHMAIRCKADFDNEIDECKRQLLADRCVAIIGVEVDAFYDSLACENEITQDEMFSEMKRLIPHTSNPSITDTIYYTRQANKSAFEGKIYHAQNMLIQARTSAFCIQNCPELVNMLYVEVYVKLWEFEINPSKSILNAIMMWGRIGLQSLETESEATKLLWRRMFILRMVFGLLGIGNRANIIPEYTVDSSSLQEAQTLLAVVDANWNGIEVRREMFYCVARARLNEQLERFEEAKQFIARAKLLAVQGRFLEKIPFIDEFTAVIDGKIGSHSSSLYSSNIQHSSNGIGDMDMTSIRPESAFDNNQTILKCPDQGAGLRYPLSSNEGIPPEDVVTSDSKRWTNTNIVFGAGSSVPFLETLKCVGESELFQHEEASQLGASSLCQTAEFNEHCCQSSDRNCNIKIQNLKCLDRTSSFNACLAHDKTCHSSMQQPHCKDIELIATSTTRIEELEPTIQKLNLSGGNLVFSSGNLPVTESCPCVYNFSNYSNTEVKVLERSNGSLSYLQSDNSGRKRTEMSIARSQLLHQCQEGVDFGSVALFEERSQGDGASHVSSKRIMPDQTQKKAGLSTYGTRDIDSCDEDTFYRDIDDEALFGDGK